MGDWLQNCSQPRVPNNQIITKINKEYSNEKSHTRSTPCAEPAAFSIGNRDTNTSKIRILMIRKYIEICTYRHRQMNMYTSVCGYECEYEYEYEEDAMTLEPMTTTLVG